MTNINQYKLETTFYEGSLIHSYWAQPSKTWKEERIIGEGGFGSVWLEREERTGELRAVKRIFRGRSRNFSFSRELRALIKVGDNKNLFVQFLGWYEDRNFIFVAMEYLENGDLGQYIKDFRPKAKLEVKEITEQLLEGLKFLHERKICHRDLKPKNILIACHSPIRVKLVDFGTSKSTIGTSLRTRCGTAGYMAPELHGLLPRTKARGSYTTSLDMWSLGCLIYEILTSKIPFMQEPVSEVLSSTTSETSMNDTPGVDMHLLSQLCLAHISLPTDLLRESRVTERGIGFLRKLLVADPASRITAADALRSRWLFDLPHELDHEDSSKALKAQFLSLGLDFDIKDIDLLVLECKEYQGVNITELFKGLDKRSLSFIFNKAAEYGYTLVLELLLQVVGSFSEVGRCLQIVAEHGYFDAVRLLLSKGLYNGKGDPSTFIGLALHGAVKNGRLEVARLLLDKGADANYKLDSGWAALHEAAAAGNLEMVTLLLDNGADVNRELYYLHGTALHQAVKNGRLGAAKLLLDRGADANYILFSGLTALHLAAMAGNLKMVILLLGNGADVNGGLHCYHGTALHQAIKNGRLEVARLLLDRGADFNHILFLGLTALDEAVELGNIEILRLFQDRGASFFI